MGIILGTVNNFFDILQARGSASNILEHSLSRFTVYCHFIITSWLGLGDLKRKKLEDVIQNRILLCSVTDTRQ